MSYSKTYNGSVAYSGSVSYTYSYPASEHGGSGSGTAHYSGQVPVSVNLYVDTDPFDSSVADCSHSVRTLNGAVVAMNSSQVASIAKSANEVSSHIISGFFNMIGSELSQNMAALAAKFKAVFELLTTKSSTLEKQQVVMQDDYSRISDRYNKVFQNLDEELEKRVVALDKNVFEISKRVQGEQLHSEASKKVTQFLIGVNEDEIVQQQLIIANAKARVLQAMDGLAQNVVQENAYSNKVNSIITEKNCNSGEANYIPVIYTESSSLNSDIVDYNCFSNPKSSNSILKINETVKSYFVSNYSNSNSENEMKKINDAFTLIAEKEFQNLTDEKSRRVYEVLTKLKEN
jgi:hypothetical protein